MSTSEANDKDPANEVEEVPTNLNDFPRIITVKSTIQDIWRPYYKEPLHKLVDTTNRLVTHTYSFAKYIFLKEMESTNDRFDLNSYVKKGFFVEVFLSLIKRQVRDGAKSGKSRLSAGVSRHKDEYFELNKLYSTYTYQCSANRIAQFGNRLRMFLNSVCKVKEKSADIRKRMTTERYSEEYINDIIKTNVLQPCNQIKDKISKKQVPTDTSMLSPESLNQINNFILIYPVEYNFKKSSIYYDVKASPQNHFKAFYKLVQLCQLHDLKSFHCFPLRCSFIPGYMTLDTKIVNYHILEKKNMTEDKDTIWNQVINTKTKAMKGQGNQKSLQFRGTMQTDGIGTSIIKQNFSTTRTRLGEGSSRTNSTDNDELKYVEALTRSQHEEIKGRCVLMDPNRCDLLYCMKETSTVQDKKIFRYTQVHRNKQARRFKILRKRLSPSNVLLAQNALSKTNSSSVTLLLFVDYLKARVEHGNLLYEYYGNETGTTTQDLNCDSSNRFNFRERNNLFWGHLFVSCYTESLPRSNIDAHDERQKLQTFILNLQLMLSQRHIQKRVSQNIIDDLLLFVANTLDWLNEHQQQEALKEKLNEIQILTNKQLQTLNFLPFRKMRFSDYTYYKQNDYQLVRSLRQKFGSDSVLILGNWSAPTTKFHESIRNKGLVKMLQKNGFAVFLIDEFKTSSVCPDCEGQLKKFKKVKNPRPFNRNKMPSVICNGLLKCENHSPPKPYNRDLAAVCNFRKILYQLRSAGTRPCCLSRPAKGRQGPQTSTQRKKPRSSA